MMKYYFPIHLDGGNRGCEAIAKGTAQILGVNKEKLFGYCQNIELDTRLELNKFYTLVPTKKLSFNFRVQNRLHSMLVKDVGKRRNYVYSYKYDKFLDLVGKDDVMLSTGGDMFCYNNCEANYTVNYLAAKHRKTVLWGCSIGENNLTPEKIVALHNFSAVVARDSLTKDLFVRMGLNNIHLYPDTAFILEPEICELPEEIQQGETIGINLSNFIGHDVTQNSILGKNIRNLIAYILKNTSLKILFIPHVLWSGQDDRIICKDLLKEFLFSERVFLLDSDKYNYCQIRYIISKCALFIGARTHSVISAYSTCVPTLALGYSIKSKGIAKDLDLPESSVVNSIGVKTSNEIADAFAAFLPSAEKMRTHLERMLPSYKEQLNDAKTIFEKL